MENEPQEQLITQTIYKFINQINNNHSSIDDGIKFINKKVPFLIELLKECRIKIQKTAADAANEANEVKEAQADDAQKETEDDITEIINLIYKKVNTINASYANIDSSITETQEIINKLRKFFKKCNAITDTPIVPPNKRTNRHH
jgi:prefoldin subunit 5